MSLILSGTDGLSDVDGSAATPAIRGTDANTGIFFPAADTIAFAEGGAEVARFNSSGQLGIGQTSPAYLLDVNGTMRLGSAGTIQPLLLRSTVTGGLTVNTTAAGGAGPLVVQDNGTEVFRVTDSLVVLKGGSTSATGTGITFPATQSASSDANTLDDYEEGTWTPTIGDSDGVSFTMTAQNGTYTKIGRMIIVQFYIAYSGKGSANAGYYAHIRGWPFASFYTGNKTGTNVAVHQPSLEISATAGRLSLYPSGDASNGVYTLLNGAGPQLVSFYPSSGSLQGTMIGFE